MGQKHDNKYLARTDDVKPLCDANLIPGTPSFMSLNKWAGRRLVSCTQPCRELLFKGRSPDLQNDFWQPANLLCHACGLRWSREAAGEMSANYAVTKYVTE